LRSRLSLPLAEWPTADREAWRLALLPEDEFFEELSPAAQIRPATLPSYIWSYGEWLAFLETIGELHADECPGTRPTQERIQRWMAEHRARNLLPTSRRQALLNLSAMLRLMVPGADLKFIIHPGGRPLKRVIRGKPRPFVARDVADVRPHIRRLHKEGVAAAPGPKRWQALRDAALMGILVTRAPRVGSIVHMRINDHIWQGADGIWNIRFPPEHVKNNRRLDYPLDAKCSAMLMDYLRLARSRFPHASLSDHLWMGMKGGMTVEGLKRICRQRTFKWFGQAHGPHAARKWLRTTAGRRSPELALAAAEILGHSLEVSLASYTESTNLHAALRHGDRMTRLLDRCAAIGEREFADPLATPLRSKVPGITGRSAQEHRDRGNGMAATRLNPKEALDSTAAAGASLGRDRDSKGRG